MATFSLRFKLRTSRHLRSVQSSERQAPRRGASAGGTCSVCGQAATVGQRAQLPPWHVPWQLDSDSESEPPGLLARPEIMITVGPEPATIGPAAPGRGPPCETARMATHRGQRAPPARRRAQGPPTNQATVRHGVAVGSVAA
jgi:hypothetical protein